MTDLLTAEKLTKRYGDNTVLDEVSLTLGSGRTLALLGHNGAGKTTFIKVMLGLTRPNAGRLSLLGGNPCGSKGAALRRKIGYLPESLAFPQSLAGLELLQFYGALKGVSKRDCRALLEQVGLSEAAEQTVRSYSKGMRQRLGLAQALLGQPALLFLDEPTNGLDPPLRQEFYRLIARLTGGGASALISSHVLTEIEARADLIAILRAGRLVAFGSLEELRARSALPYRLNLQVPPENSGQIVESMGQDFFLEHNENGALAFVCDARDKMRILRSVAKLNGVVQDVDIQAPRLEDIYRHYMIEDAAADANDDAAQSCK
jgi:Cu-processing system ATP-binding protein